MIESYKHCVEKNYLKVKLVQVSKKKKCIKKLATKINNIHYLTRNYKQSPKKSFV